MSVPYTLSIHLYGGQTITLACTTFEIVPAGILRNDDGNPVHDEHGNHIETPMRLNYSPVDEWQRTLGFLDFRAISAIEVERSEEMIAADNERREEPNGVTTQAVARPV